jgi:hypothetical protein
MPAPAAWGKRQAAERARERIQARLKKLEAEEPPIEFRLTLADQWSRNLFVALMRRYGIHPYRYRGQRRTTVMARLSRSFVNDTHSGRNSWSCRAPWSPSSTPLPIA